MFKFKQMFLESRYILVLIIDVLNTIREHVLQDYSGCRIKVQDALDRAETKKLF